MKNIHLIPTDNYSQLVNSTSKYGGLFLSKYYSPMKDMGDSYQNIYITSDVEIKTLEYEIYYDKVLKKVGNAKSYGKKIILTTDQDLIKDGVQAIQDDFLEWFVNNPKCEQVEVVKEMYMPQSNGKISDGKITHELSLNESLNTLPFYRIIIPKEEPKQVLCGEANKFYRCITCDAPCGSEGHYIEVTEEQSNNDMNKILWISNNIQCKQIESCYNSLSKKCICPKEEPKQETLENIAKSEAFEFSVDYKPWETDLDYREYAEYGFEKGFIEGAKYQAKGMYSEKEVLAMLLIKHNGLTPQYVLEQFKKK